MSRRDWIIVLALSAAALLVAWPNLRESTLGLLLTGRCDHWLGRGRTGGCYEDPERREQRRPGGVLGGAPNHPIPRPD
ncbi:hypothetical protein [Craurococcus roseus]|uniref:hypothetical protein n=1 Tax=Craurococcus roseus TaxID=77585 RepID=UPI0031E268E9